MIEKPNPWLPTQATMLVILVLASFNFCGQSRAAQVDDLYSATVTVADQSEELRSQAIRRAFNKMLVRVSGKPSVASSPSIRDGASKAPAYLLTFAYLQPSALDIAKGQTGLLFKASFDPASVNRLLADSGEPVWGASRPRGIFWIAVSEGRERHIIADQDTNPYLSNALKSAAEQRGLPILLPLMDLEDRQSISVTDVWGRFESPIRLAASRYANDFIVAGQVSGSSSNWEGRYVLYSGAAPHRFTTRGSSSTEVLARAVDAVTNHLAGKLAAVETATADNVITIEVSNLQNFDDYLSMSAGLRRLSMVRKVAPQRIDDTTAVINLEVIGQVNNLLEALKLEDNLRPEGIDAGQTSGQVLQFRWVP